MLNREGTTFDSRTSALAKYLGTYPYCVDIQTSTFVSTSCLYVVYAGASLTDTEKYGGLESVSLSPSLFAFNSGRKAR